MVLFPWQPKRPYPFDSVVIVRGKLVPRLTFESKKRLASNDLALYLVHTIPRLGIVRAWGTTDLAQGNE